MRCRTPPTSSTTTRPSARPTWGSERWKLHDDRAGACNCSSSRSSTGQRRGLRIGGAGPGPHLPHHRRPQLRPGRDGAVRHLHLLEADPAGPAGRGRHRRLHGHRLRQRRGDRAHAHPPGRDRPQPAQRGDRDAGPVPGAQLAGPAHLRDRPAVHAVRFPSGGIELFTSNGRTATLQNGTLGLVLVLIAECLVLWFMLNRTRSGSSCGRWRPTRVGPAARHQGRVHAHAGLGPVGRHRGAGRLVGGQPSAPASTPT